MQKPILHTIAGTGTPSGWGFWSGWLGCKKAAWLRHKAGRRDGLSGNFAMDVGTVDHLYMDLYYDRGDMLNTGLVQFVDPSDSPTSHSQAVIKEADRVFRQYRVTQASPVGGPREFGRVLEKEKPHKTTNFRGHLHTLTWRPDVRCLLSRSDVRKDHLAHLGLEEGMYLVDHKFFGKHEPWTAPWVQYDLRFKVYNEAQALETPQLKGTLVNAVYRLRDVERQVFFVPRATPAELARMDSQLQLAAQEERENINRPTPPIGNSEHCITRFGACPFLGKVCPGF